MTLPRKKLIIFSLSLFLLLLIVIIALQLVSKKTSPTIDQNTNSSSFSSTPAAISADERQKLGIDDNIPLEVINRDSEGNITTYRLIK